MTESVEEISPMCTSLSSMLLNFLLHLSQKFFRLADRKVSESLMRFIQSHFDFTARHFLKVKHTFFNPYIFHGAQL
jgi:hypothetical protein